MADFPHCETCRFWGEPDEPPQEFQTCEAVVYDIDGLAGDWFIHGRHHTPEGKEFRAAHKAVVIDAEEYYAKLKTRRDFGCVLHEPREPRDPSNPEATP